MLLVLGCLHIAVLLGSASSEDPQVRVTQGLLRGELQQVDGVTLAAFRGIPYATPPVGPRRFQLAEPPEAWSGVRSAVSLGASCLQWTRENQVAGSEDCLYLNVFAPWPLEPTRLRPVLVFLHGGAFMYGSGSLVQPDLIVPGRDVLLVSLNYRLGLLGFLSTGDLVVPGNNGLKDQQAALRWLRGNVANFGGDPERVTLAGLSAGGASVHYHMLAPGSRGLFHAGVSLSGSATCRWAQADRLPDKTRALAAHFGCARPDDSRSAVECLRALDGHTLVAATELFMPWRANPFSPWAPTIEPNSPEAFLTESPDATLRAQAGEPNVPWLVGVTSHEGLYPAAEFLDDVTALDELQRGWDWLAPALLDLNACASPEEAVMAARAARAHYLPEGRVAMDTVPQLVQMVGDRHFVAELERSARLQAAASPTWLYRFSYRGARSFSDAMSGTSRDLGACHGDDLAYVLRSPFSDSRSTAQDAAMSDLLLGVWTAFVERGVPEVGGVAWQPVLPGDQDISFLDVVGPGEVRPTVARELGQRAFWDALRIYPAHVSVTRQMPRDEL